MYSLSDPSEIYNLKMVNKTLYFDVSTDIAILYLEAYSNGLWVSIRENPVYNMLVLDVLPQPKIGEIAEQLVYCCKADNETKFTYSGELSLPSLRTALYSCAKKLDVTIKTGHFDKVLFCFKETSTAVQVSNYLIGMEQGDTRSIPLERGADIALIRASVFNFARRNDWKISTKVIGNRLVVTRERLYSAENDTKEWLKEWSDKMPWDVPIPLPQGDFEPQHIRVTLSRYRPGVFTINNGIIVKNSVMLCKYEGLMSLFIRGSLVESFSVSKRAYLDQEDIGRINHLVKGFNKSYEDL